MNIYKYFNKPEELDNYHNALSTPDIALDYMYDHMKDPKNLPKEVIAGLAKDARIAYIYADTIKGSFPEGEPTIAKDALHSYRYARYVLKGKPFPAGEKAIANDPLLASLYAIDILHKRFKEAEPLIFKVYKSESIAGIENKYQYTKSKILDAVNDYIDEFEIEVEW